MTAQSPTIFLVHHGETEWNRERRYQGLHDSPLTPHGRRQVTHMASLLAQEVRYLHDVRLVSSPLGRAVETAEIIGAALRLPVTTDSRAMELSLGAWEGLTRPEIEAMSPGALAGASRWDWYFRAPGGETFEAAATRLAAWLRELRRPTVLIGHGVAGRILRGLYGGLAREEALQPPVRRDAVFKLAAGQITLLETPQVP